VSMTWCERDFSWWLGSSHATFAACERVDDPPPPHGQIDVVAGAYLGDLCPGTLLAPVSVAASQNYIAVVAADSRLVGGAAPGSGSRRAVHVLGNPSREVLRVVGSMTEARSLRLSYLETEVLVANRDGVQVFPLPVVGSGHRDPEASTRLCLPGRFSSPYDVEECEGGCVVAAIGGERVVFVPSGATAGNPALHCPPTGLSSDPVRFRNPNSVVYVCGLGLLVREGSGDRVQVREGGGPVESSQVPIAIPGFRRLFVGILSWSSFPPLLVIFCACSQVLVTPQELLVGRMSQHRVGWMVAVYRAACRRRALGKWRPV
jgi:hypothetical protein